MYFVSNYQLPSYSGLNEAVVIKFILLAEYDTIWQKSPSVLKIGALQSKLYPYKGNTRDIQSNIALGLRKFPRAKPEATPEGEGLNLSVDPELNPNMDII